MNRENFNNVESRDQKIIFIFAGVLLIVIVVLAIVISMLFRQVSPDQTSDASVAAPKIDAAVPLVQIDSPPPTPPPGPVIKRVIYERPFQIGSFEFIMHPVNVVSRIGTRRARSGVIFLTVIADYVNTENIPVRARNLPVMQLIDPEGVLYNHDIGLTGELRARRRDLESKIISDANPGVPFRQAWVFEVSESRYDTGRWTFLITADDTHKIIFPTNHFY
jgi:hypothetical protein